VKKYWAIPLEDCGTLVASSSLTEEERRDFLESLRPYERTDKEPTELDSFTRELAKADDSEDPYCCTPVRFELVNKIRAFFHLPELGDDELSAIAWPKPAKPPQITKPC
jgi:hypothetical protein